MKKQRMGRNNAWESDPAGAIAGGIPGARVGSRAIGEKRKTDPELFDMLLKISDGLYEEAERCEREGAQ